MVYSNAMDQTRAAILEDVVRIVREVIAEDWVNDLAITMETSFDADLELASIEFVALAERLTERHGAKVDFAGWLATKEFDQIVKLSVGDLVDFIAQSKGSQPAS